MAKITDDPKVQELLAKTEAKHEAALEKAVSKARKEALKEFQDVVKEYLDYCAEIEDKAQRKYTQTMMKGIIANIKGL